jgi:Glycosyl hydrolase catalytic core
MHSRRHFLAMSSAALFLGKSEWAKPQAFLPEHSLRITQKKGLAGAAPEASGLRTSWYYDWGVDPSRKGISVHDAGMRFVPMCWGWNVRSLSSIENLRARKPALLFGFNEPDHVDQSNLSVDAALEAWPNLQGIATELVSPSCAQPQDVWMQNFMATTEKSKLQVNSVGFHHYGPPEPQDFIRLLERVHTMYGRPIWVTEFAAADWQAKEGGPNNRYTEQQMIDFMQAVCKFMEETSWVRGYAWYPWGKPGGGGPLSVSSFFDTDEKLTMVGQAYAAL